MTTCTYCKDKFKTKWHLMEHRAHLHPIQKTCVYFVEGNCRFGDNCAYLHNMNKPEIIKCNTGKKEFKTKKDMMWHRKNEHFTLIRSCRNHFKGNCSFADSECWYRHVVQMTIKDGKKNIEANTDINKKKQDFHQEKPGTKTK